MIKRIVLFCVVVLLTLSFTYGIHDYYLSLNNINLTYSLFNIYVYFAVFSIVIYSAVEWLINIVPNQVGYAYMASVFLKIGVFVLLFKNSFFSDENLEMPQKLAVVIPFFLFLIIEGLGVTRLLNKL